MTPGNRILIDDGLVEMEVESVVGEEIRCLVKNTGVISARKGVNVPGAVLSLPFINEKDYNDLRFAVEQGFDFVAASFTRTYEDMRELKHILKELGGEKIDIVHYDERIEDYVANALAPAEVISVTMTGERACRVRVAPDQLSLAIGKEGQNARLAARLTGCKIDIKSSDYED